MKTTTEKQDHEIAKDEMLALWPGLGLAAKTSALGLRTDAEKWKHCAFNVHFQQTKLEGKSVDFDWHHGTGIKGNPLAVEVLACCCRDYRDASGEPFEEWAGTFGYDVDSRKAERIYQECLEIGNKLKLILTGEQISRLAELSARL